MSSPTVGILGDDAAAAAVTAAGGEPVAGRAAIATTEPTVVVAVGERALHEAVVADIDVPVLPVDAGRNVRSVPRDGLESALRAVFAGDYETTALPLLAARSPLGTTHALSDVMLVAAEPARISEYTVRSGGELVATFRADGVVVATPAGSHGYARRANGPVLATGVDALTVVPVAAFATDEDAWVVSPEELELSVERDETPVELLADDRTAGAIVSGESVHVDRDGALAVAVVEASRRPFS